MSRQTRELLLVEDSEDDADLTLRAFRSAGMDCKIVLVRDGMQALDYVFARGRWAGRDPNLLPFLILLDLKMPNASGLDVLREIRKKKPARPIPVVVMSCSTEQADIASSYELGANAYVRKPVELAEFVEATRALGLFWLLVNEPPPARPS